MHLPSKNVFHIVFVLDKKAVENALWKTNVIFVVFGIYDNRNDQF